MVDIELIARVCHEVNRVYCDIIGDTPLPPWTDLPIALQGSTLRGVDYVITHPEDTAAEQHAEWMRERLAAGWVHGDVKDSVAKTHPNLVPYEQLSAQQQAKDALFRGVVTAMLEAMQSDEDSELEWDFTGEDDAPLDTDVL
jgi:hypothetical protein